MKLKPGDEVLFQGTEVGGGPKKLVIKPVRGKLILADSNTSIPGVMRIEGDKQNMLFLPNGMIYCHTYLGVLCKKIPKTRKKSA